MHKAHLYVPTAVDSGVKSVLTSHLIDKFGGYTEYDGKGAWQNPETGQEITEDVKILEVLGMKEGQAKSTARWLSDRSEESEVLWTHQTVNGGFE